MSLSLIIGNLSFGSGVIYCAVSGGGASLDAIKSYIQSQGKDD
jgi:hypothetical protein